MKPKEKLEDYLKFMAGFLPQVPAIPGHGVPYWDKHVSLGIIDGFGVGKEWKEILEKVPDGNPGEWLDKVLPTYPKDFVAAMKKAADFLQKAHLEGGWYVYKTYKGVEKMPVVDVISEFECIMWQIIYFYAGCLHTGKDLLDPIMGEIPKFKQIFEFPAIQGDAKELKELAKTPQMKSLVGLFITS